MIAWFTYSGIMARNFNPLGFPFGPEYVVGPPVGFDRVSLDHVGNGDYIITWGQTSPAWGKAQSPRGASAKHPHP